MDAELSVAGDQGLACPAGTHGLPDPTSGSGGGAARGGWPPCAVCAFSTYAAADGATACVACGAGWTAKAGAVACIACPAELQIGSPLLEAGNEEACAACGFSCCSSACFVVSAPPPTTRPASAPPSSLPPPLALTTAERPRTTTAAAAGGGGSLGGGGVKLSTTEMEAGGPQTTPATTQPNVCGNGALERYPTACW